MPEICPHQQISIAKEDYWHSGSEIFIEAADEIKRLRAIEAKLIATADDDAGGILGEYAAKVLGERVMRLPGREVEE